MVTAFASVTATNDCYDIPIFAITGCNIALTAHGEGRAERRHDRGETQSRKPGHNRHTGPSLRRQGRVAGIREHQYKDGASGPP